MLLVVTRQRSTLMDSHPMIKIGQWNPERIPTPAEFYVLQELFKKLTGKSDIPNDFNQRFFLTIRSATVFVAEDMTKGTIAGMGIVHTWCVPSTGEKAYIDDIVVLPEYRGQSIGKRILEKLMETARRAGARKISLTSNPKITDRKIAIRLYRKLGFKKKYTSLYELTL